ncbi:uncharacterized protein LOC144822393 [Lissotriton helveticus]
MAIWEGAGDAAPAGATGGEPAAVAGVLLLLKPYHLQNISSNQPTIWYMHKSPRSRRRGQSRRDKNNMTPRTRTAPLPKALLLAPAYYRPPVPGPAVMATWPFRREQKMRRLQELQGVSQQQWRACSSFHSQTNQEVVGSHGPAPEAGDHM